MISIEHLTYEYPGVRALDDVSLRIGVGDITALVGPNGAGKTTLLRSLAGLDTPVAGAIRVNNVDVLLHPRLAHRHMGYLPDFFGLYQELTVRQCLTYAALAHDIAPEHASAAVLRAAQRLQIDDRMAQRVDTLSRGLSQRLAIAQAIVHEPLVLLLDEPASGLDPEARYALSQLFLSLRDQGMTIVVSSHILAELEEYSDSMVIVQQGRIVEHQRLHQRDLGYTTVTIGVVSGVEELRAVLARMTGVSIAAVDGDTVTVNVSAAKEQQQQLLRQLVTQNISVHSFAVQKLNMQDAYLKQTGQRGLAP